MLIWQLSWWIVFYIVARIITITIWRWFRNIFCRVCPSHLMWYSLILWSNLLPNLWCIIKRFSWGRKNEMVTEEHSWFIWMWAVEIGGVVITFTVHLHGCQKQGLKDLIFVSRLRQSVQGRATMAKTVQCADGLEKVVPIKYGHFWYLC